MVKAVVTYLIHFDKYGTARAEHFLYANAACMRKNVLYL